MSTFATQAVLLVAIVTEVIGTTFLARSDGLTKLVPSVITLVCYACAIWCLAIVMRTMPTGIVYAIWSGCGIVLISAVAWVFHGQKLDAPAVVGLGLIISGVLVVNLFSKTVQH